MAFDDTYRESIQTKHIANVGFTSTAKGVTNEAYALSNPHQVIASQIPAVDVVGTYGALTADGISAGLVEEHTVKLTADPTVNNNKAWIATEDNCTTAGHSTRGSLRIDQWMRYAETQYKLRLFEDDGTGTGPNMSAEILPSETSFNWEYDASAGIVYFDDDPSSHSKTLPLWGVVYTYVGDSVEDGLGATTSGVSDLVDLFNDTNEPSGFVNRTDSTISFDDATRTFTISGSEFSYYNEGTKYTKNGEDTVQIADTEGMHYIYYDGETLTHTTTSPLVDIIYTKAYVASVYWDATNDEAIYFGEERHGITMDGQTHGYLHSAFGTQYISGLALTGIDADGDGTSADHAQLAVASGLIRDEDLAITINSTGSPGSLPVYYKDGASGVWRRDAATVYPMKSFSGGSGLVAWNEWTGAVWQQNETANGSYTLSHIFATNDSNNSAIVVQGQAEYATVTAAREGANEELNSLILAGLPFVEFVPVATIIIQTSTTFTNVPKAIIVTTTEGDDYVDWRFSGLTPTPTSVNSHANLIGRDFTDSHPAAAISTVTTNFDGALSSSDTDVQDALDTLDDAVQTNTDAITALDAELTTASGVLQTQIDTNATNITNNYNTLDTKIDTTSGTLQTEIDSVSSDLANNYYTKTDLDGGQLDNRYYTETEVDSLLSDIEADIATTSGTLQTQITQNATDITNNYNTLDGKIDTTSGTLQTQIDSNDTDISNLQSDLSALDAELTTASGVLQSQIDSNDTDISNLQSDLSALDAELTTASGVLQDQIDALDDTYATDAELAAVSGTLQSSIDTNATNITNNYNTLNGLITDLDAELTTASGYLQSQIDSLDDTYATDAELATTSGVLQTNIDNLTTTVNNNYTTLDNKIDTTSGTLQSEIDALDTSLTDAIIWEVVDTPSDQIRPKAAHQGKAIYSAGNLTIGGDLTVSGTTTTVHSEELTVADKVITVNAGETGAGITGDQYAGIEVDRGSETNYMFVFDEVQDNFRIGISGSLQAVATREDSPTDQYVAYWNQSEYRFDTTGGIAVGDIASQTFVTSAITTLSGALQDQIDSISSDLSNNYYTKTELDAGQLDNRYYTETELDAGQLDNRYYTETEVDSLISDIEADIATTSGTLQSAIDDLTTDLDDNYYTKTEADAAFDAAGAASSAVSAHETTYDHDSYDTHLADDTLHRIINDSGTSSTELWSANKIDSEITSAITSSGTVDHALLTNLDYASSGHTGFAPTVHTHTESDITDLGNYSVVGHGHSISDVSGLQTALDDRYTETEVDNLLAAQDEFLELNDVDVTSFSAGRVLFTTASGVTDDANFTFDTVSGTLSTLYLSLESGTSVNEIVDTVTSGTTNDQIPTAKAVWDLTEAAAAAVHTHSDVDASYVSNTSWTYGTGFSAVPDDLQIFVNGVKQRVGATYDCTVDVPGGVLTITFLYNVYSDSWVNVTYTT